MVLRPEDYTVAWFAPLEIEAKVARHMLDHRHQGVFAVDRGDDVVSLNAAVEQVESRDVGDFVLIAHVSAPAAGRPVRASGPSTSGGWRWISCWA